MKISASVQSNDGKYQVVLQTDGNPHSITIPPKPNGQGSSVNGGEALCLALATCYCNDLYREAAKRGIKVEAVEVEVDSEFGGVGEPAKSLVYHAKVTAQATADEIRDLMRHTDTVAEIQNTLRLGMNVILQDVEAIEMR